MPTHRIGKRYSFDAAHHLPSLPDGHKCRRQHGHTYIVEIVLASGELVGPGFVADFGDLAGFRAYIDRVLDHQDLNEVLKVEPTCEAIAMYLAEWYLLNLADSISGRLTRVRVWETPTSWGEYQPDGAS